MRILIILLLILSAPVYGQKQKTKNSYARGTLFGYWGYNRSFYSKSTIRFQGNGYDFQMKGSVAHDNPDPVSWKYFDPARITVPQFNARLGYYIRDHWAISFGYDHMKYIFADQNHVRLSGYVAEGIDTVSGLSGNYDDVEYVTDRTNFHYENSDGLNYLRFEVTRTDQWYATRSKWFAFSTNLGLGTGGILSFNDFRFAGRDDRRTISLSGYGISGHVGARFEFFKHIFLQSNFSGGFMHQLNVKTRPNEPTARARHYFGYGELDLVIGFLLYIRPTNDCNSCPHW